MLKIITSKSIYKARERMLIEMNGKRSLGTTQLVVVPDRFAMSAESEILRELGIKGSFDIVVASFMKLAKKVLGDKAQDSMTAEGAVMLLTRAISKCRDKLGVYKKASFKAGFAKELYAVIASIRKNCYSPLDLRAVLPKLPEYVRLKCSDVLCVYEEYVKELSLGKMDGSTLLEDLAEAIPDSDFISGAHVYLMDFFSYTAEQRRVIKQLIKCAESVTIPCLKGKGANCRIYDTRDVEMLIDFARANGKLVETVEVDAELGVARNLVADRMFSYKRGERVSGGEVIKVYEAESLEGEVEHLARTILALTKEGYRYRDVSVLAGDIEAVTPLIKRIFNAHAIPVFCDEGSLLSSTPVARYLVSAIRLKNRMDVTDCLALLKNAYTGVCKNDVLDFQNHCSRYNIERLTITSPIPLGKNFSTYEGAERARGAIQNSVFEQKSEATAKEYADNIRVFLDAHAVKDKSEREALLMEAQGDFLYASRDRQAVTKLYGVLDQIDRLMADTVLKKEEFEGVLLTALESVKISYTPTYVDSVYVGGAKKSRFTDCKVFCIIGAQSGALPLSAKRTGILGENEERALKKFDFDLSPSAKQASAEEMLHVTQLLIMDKEKTYVSYTPTKGSSEIVDELTAIFDDVTVNSPYDLFEKDEDWLNYYAPTKEGALYSYTHASCERYEEDLKRALGIIDEEEKSWTIQNGRELFFPKSTTSVSQLATYFTCPYKHYFSYGLRARSEVKASNPIIAGNFLHLVFEKGVKALSKAGYPDTASGEYKKIVDRVITEVEETDEFSIFKNEGWTATVKRLADEGKRALKSLAERIINSEYKPSSYEYSFGADEPFYIKGDRVEVRLVGKIDRIDKLGNKAILIDYKTGKAHGTIKDVYYGVGVQLALYMKALDKTGANTVGAFYYPIQDGYTEGDRAKLLGNIVTDELLNFDTTWSYAKSSDYVDVTYDDKAKPTAKTEDTLLSKTELQAVKDYSERVSKKAVDEICDGWIAPSPIEKAKCKWCSLRPLCSGRERVRQTRSVKKATIVGGTEDEQVD